MRALFYAALCFVCGATPWLLYARGHTLIALFAALFMTCPLWRLRRDPLVAAQLRWSQGLWTLEQGGVRRAIVPTRRSTATPWVIYLAFSDPAGGCGGHLWLYADCASPEQLRRLRVRLTLDCG